jgi:hypothetical protein
MQSSARELLVVHVSDPETSDLNLMKLAVFVGIPVRDISLTGGLGAQRDGMDINPLLHVLCAVKD